MKKLAFTTLGCPQWSFAKILEEAEKMGFSGIEIRGLDGKMLAEEMEAFFPENKDATLQALKKHNLVITGFGSSVKFDHAEKFDDVIAEGKRAIDVCGFMGIPAIRIFGDRFQEGEPQIEMLNRIAKGAQILAEYGKDKGVRVLLETHGDINNLERVKTIYDQVQSSNFGHLWDIGNTHAAYGDNFAEFYRVMKDKISHIHIKDFICENPQDSSTFKHCRIGHGHVPIKAIVKMLMDEGYQGYYTLEWEKKWHPELAEPEVAFPEFVQLMKEV